MTKISTRNHFPNLLISMGLTGGAAFIGVAEASWEFSFLERWPGRARLIDVWRILDAPGFTGHGESTNEGLEARYQRVLRNACLFGTRITVLRMTSIEGAAQIADGSLDFAYVDSDHSLEAARIDVPMWAKKVKPGGVLAGHDYLAGNFNGQEYGVKTVVDAFAASRGLTVNVVPEEWPSFFLQL